MTARFSLAQQIEAVSFALTRQRALARGGTVRSMRGASVEQYDCDRLAAVERTLVWLRTHEAEIKAFLEAKAERSKTAAAKPTEP
jgi:hypothetical protein